jgi:hypothetical protein
MNRRTALVAALLLATASAAAGAEPRAPQRLVVIPFENASRNTAARAVVMDAVERELARRGFSTVTGAPVDAYLESKRIRYLDSLTPDQVKDLLAAHRANGIVLGSILTYTALQDQSVVAIAVRVIGPDGEVLWGDVRVLSTADTVGVLGTGKVKTVEGLARRVATALVSTIPAGGSLSRRRIRRAAPVERAPRVYRAQHLTGAPVKIAILPLENLTDQKDAARVVDTLLHQRLAERLNVSVVQPADLRAGIVALGFRAPSQMSPEQLRKLGDALGTALFVRGAIFRYGHSEDGADVELYLSLVDVATGRIVWSGLHRRTGQEYQGLLQFGALREPISLADRTVAELLDAFRN